MPYLYEFCALGAGFCWALGGIFSEPASRALGAMRFSRIRMTIIVCPMLLYTFTLGDWQAVTLAQSLPIALSGIVGIFIGDFIMFSSINRIGVRLTSMLFATNAPMSVLLAWMLLGEVLSLSKLIGIALCIAGVMLAIVYGSKKPSEIHHWQEIRGPLWIGIVLGLGAALAQAAGSLLVRPIMQMGQDPIVVSTLRVAVAVLALNTVGWLLQPHASTSAPPKLTSKLLFGIVFSGVAGMLVGMTLVVFALSGAKSGIVATLSATTPVMILPMLWIKNRVPPALPAWIGALLMCVGCALIFLIE